MLFRMHHLILAEEQDLRLSDLLLVDSFPTSTSIHLNESSEAIFNDSSDPFNNLIPTAVHIPQLYNELTLVICNKWNELLNNYNRFEDDDSEMNKHQGVFKLMVLIFISIVTVIMDFSKGFSAVKDDAFIKLKYFLSLCRREIERRNLSISCIVHSTLVSLHPKNIIESIFNTIVWVVVTWCILLPLIWLRELIAVARFLMDPREYSEYIQHLTK